MKSLATICLALALLTGCATPTNRPTGGDVTGTLPLPPVEYTR